FLFIRSHSARSLPSLPTRRSSDLALARWCLANHFFLNVEIKPTPGQEAETGRVVAELMGRIWPRDIAQPLFTSFKPAALQAAKEDRKSTRLNSSHVKSSYAVFCLK